MDGMKIRVGAVDYNVKEVENLHDNGRELFGWVTYGDCTIRLDAAMDKCRKEGVLVHEMLHAMLYEAGFDEQDEDMVNRLGNVLHGVLRDNNFEFLREAE